MNDRDDMGRRMWSARALALRLAVAATVVLAGAPAARAASVPQLFWTNNMNGDIGTAGTDGGAINEAFVTGGARWR